MFSGNSSARILQLKSCCWHQHLSTLLLDVHVSLLCFSKHKSNFPFSFASKQESSRTCTWSVFMASAPACTSSTTWCNRPVLHACTSCRIIRQEASDEHVQCCLCNEEQSTKWRPVCGCCFGCQWLFHSWTLYCHGIAWLDAPWPWDQHLAGSDPISWLLH